VRRLVPVLICLAVLGCGGKKESAVQVKVVELPGYGKVLATPADEPLYLLSSDPKDATKCTGDCTKDFKPLQADGDPGAGDGLKADMLSTFKRDDGSQQILYNGHALYTYVRADAGKGAGAGVKQDGGGTWYLVDPSGKAVESTAVGGY
jgi:predicted lipoprotein with Yx(FWY)xxD motif